MEIIFLTQTGLGILGNSSFLCFSNLTLLVGHKLRPIDLIFNQLVLANDLALFSKGIPQTMAAFGLKYFLDDVGCTLVFCFRRVVRGVSLSTTGLLSVFQAIKLCPNFPRWVKLKGRSLKYIGWCCFLCWTLNLLVNAHISMKVTDQVKSKNLSLRRYYGYCSKLMPNSFIPSIFGVIYVSIDVIHLGTMVRASGAVVLVLHRHKHRVQHIHSNGLSPRPSHEARAIRTILVLVSMFVSFYSLSSILTLCVSLIVNPGQWLVDTSVFMASCFPAFSSFVLISSEAHVSQFFFACWTRKTIFPNMVK
ncbi:vomeronasal type-1 receptor 1-like [Elephas maximus indicus]|uniref:vomeronasal type-1 receptor 1-like n=1 Tax=Elephas maximus indicus TaxID=99487 RepID=UPI00211625CD|nr:vomeronasal type-1 receptor 1-like [Elephas maximus indicus]